MMGIKNHFNLSAAEYAAHRRGAVEQRRRREVRQALDARLAEVRQVVELGCGPGKFLADLAGDYPQLAFTGIDIHAGMIDHARQTYQLPNVGYELRDITGAEGGPAADFVFSIDLIHHVHDFRPFFQAVRRMLSPAGVWLSIEPNVYHPYVYYSQERMRRAGFDEDHFRPWVVEPLFREVGFAVSSRRYASLFPGWVPRLPTFLEHVERLFENWRFLGGSVIYRLAAPKATG